MAIKLTPESFLNVVKQSNLVTGDILKRLMADLQAQGAAADSSRAIADRLVERNLLTRWQADKLLQGKHKGFFLGKYRLLKLVGKGGMSSVYLAEHVLMRRQCAIKVLPTKRVNDTSYLGRFHREAQAVASLDHPNIIKAYDVDKEMEKDVEIHFLVMEFVDGRSLQEIVQQDGPLDYESAADYIRQSAEGLAHAHAAGMVHRDIKPGNLLIDRNNIIKLLDMGLARFFNDAEEESLTVAHDEKVLGTADYLAPEQALDSHSVDARADLYSLGCTFYFLLTGHPPFTEGTLAQRLMSHQTKQPPAVTEERPDLPRGLVVILEKMMAKNRDRRYQTAAAIAQDLTHWLVEHASENWQHAHTGLSGKKLSDSGKDLAAMKTQSPPLAKPVLPVATPVVKTQSVPTSRAPKPASPVLGEPTPDAGNELSAFLANLGSSSSLEPGGVAIEDSPAESKPKRSKPASSKIRKQAKPGSKPKISPAQAVPARPVNSAKPSKSAPVAKPVPPPETDSSALEEPDFPAFEDSFAIDTSTDSRTLATFKSSSPVHSDLEERDSRDWSRLLKDKRLWAAGGLLAILLGLGIYRIVAHADKSADPANTIVQFDSDDPALIGKPILVGSSGPFQTLKEALAYVARHYDPLNASEPQVIELAGGEVFKERIHLENAAGSEFPEKVRIQTDPKNPATLQPDGPEPVIRLAKGIKELHILHLKIEAEGKEVAIRLEGTLDETRLIGLAVSGYETAGIDAESVFGGPGFGDQEHGFIIEGCEFRGGKDSIAVRMENTGSLLDGETLEEIVVRNCRFLGPMKSGLEVKNAVTSLEVLSNVFAGDGTGAGIQWTGNIQLTKVMIGNNTFYNLAEGITFAAMPEQVTQFGVHRNLFAEIKTHEAALLEGDAAEFASQFLKGSALDANCTTGEKTASDERELNLFPGKKNQAGVKLSFVSTEPGNARFLAPKEADALLKPEGTTAKIGSFKVELENHIGAVKP